MTVDKCMYFYFLLGRFFPKLKFKASEIVKWARFVAPKSVNLITRKIWVAEKLLNLHTVHCKFCKHIILLFYHFSDIFCLWLLDTYNFSDRKRQAQTMSQYVNEAWMSACYHACQSALQHLKPKATYSKSNCFSFCLFFFWKKKKRNRLAKIHFIQYHKLSVLWIFHFSLF